MKEEISATLSCFGYGYKGKVIVNGIDVGITGGKSESKRLLLQDNPMASKASADLKKLFCLKIGKNKIKVECSKTSKSPNDKFELSLEVSGYPAPLLFAHTTSGSLKSEKELPIAEKAPASFKPMFISDKAEKAVLVYVSSMNATITPSLNGKSGMTLADMPGVVVLDNVKSGKNELSISYKGTAGEEVKAVVVTPEWTKFLTLKMKDSSEKKETLTFTMR
ncbi:MAG: hypothetical protein AABX05_05135 [Nanoarchaeota archaeon]